MNSGVSEEVGSTARTAIDAMKTNPSCLAAILLAAIFAILTFFAMQKDADRKQRTTDILLERCFYSGLPKQETEDRRDE